MSIHPTAVVDSRAQIDADVEIGAYVVIDGPVVIGSGCRIMPHVTLLGSTTMGRANVVHPGAVLGGSPQDLSDKGHRSHVRIGDGNVFREHTQIHRSKLPEGVTIVGNENYFMTTSHIAHDCVIGNRVILASGCVLGGHVEIGDQAFLSGNCAVHQFVRIGRLAFLRGLSRASRDVPPFCMMDFTSTLRGLNLVGLRRNGFSSKQIGALRRAYAILFARRRNLQLALREVETIEQTDDIAELLRFIAMSKRGISMGKRLDGSAVETD